MILAAIAIGMLLIWLSIVWAISPHGRNIYGFARSVTIRVPKMDSQAIELPEGYPADSSGSDEVADEMGSETSPRGSETIAGGYYDPDDRERMLEIRANSRNLRRTG
jgi:hypothetical protein